MWYTKDMLIAVDTGGTKTLVAGFARDGKIATQVKFPTPKSTVEYIDQLQRAIKEVAEPHLPKVIVVGLPGIVTEGVAVWCNHLGWRNFDVRSPLAKHFPGVPVLVENDANLAGLAETRVLKPIPISSLYVTISTGIGTGVITDGRIDPGLRHSEGGRALVEFDGVVREWESFAAGSAIYKAFGKYARDISDRRTWNQIADRISRGFLAVVPIIQPDIIIIGGSIGTYFDQYGPQLQNILREKLPSHIPCPEFRQALHPEQAVIYGCYYYALDEIPHLSALS